MSDALCNQVLHATYAREDVEPPNSKWVPSDSLGMHRRVAYNACYPFPRGC